MQLIILFLLLFVCIENFALVVMQSIDRNDVVFSRDPPRKQAFVDVLDSAGIKRDARLTGAAWADYNNDGFLDLLTAGNRVKLYRNNGNGTFTDVTQSSRLKPKPTAAGVFGDYDNDGCKDLFFTGHARNTESLYHSNCDGTFSDVTNLAGIRKNSYYGFGAAWADYDNDGYLDLYVANYDAADLDMKHKDEPNALYHNNRDGTFTNVIEKLSVDGLTTCASYAKQFTKHAPDGWPFKESYQPLWFDYNNDGKIDLFIATDSGISPLYKNNGNGTFIEVTKEAGLCRGGTGMGVAIGDYNNDGNMDIYVTNVGANYFWHNNGDGTFTEIGAELKVADPRTLGWGIGFFDYDNDGDLDLYAVNGTVPVVRGFDPEIGKLRLDKLYRNEEDGTFLEVALQEGVEGDYSKEAAAFGDYDDNGFTDVIVLASYFARDNRHHLYRNQGNGNHWLTLQLTGTKSNRDAVGSRIILSAGGRTQVREVVSSSSFISQNSLWQTFGLGKANVVDEIKIAWPSGIEKILKNVKPDQKIVITEE